jgi:hypothetical protein
MAKNLDGDMRQGPTMCACPLGFIQQIITINAREIKLQPFNQEVLQKFTYISPRNNIANPSCNTFHQEMPKMPIEIQKCLPSTSAPHNFSQRTQE